MTSGMENRWRLVCLAFCLWSCLAGAAFSQSWPRFRGPNGGGVVAGLEFPVEWSEDDLAWQADLPGIGHSSPVLWGDLLVVTSGDTAAEERYVLALDAATGKERWRRAFPAEPHRKHKLNSFASATPAMDAAQIYTCWIESGRFVARALDHAGQPRWRADLGEFKAGHGDGVSPIVYEDLVIIAKEHEGQSELVALAAVDGTVRWRVPRESKSSWSTPCVRQDPQTGDDELIFTTWTRGVTALDPSTGAIRWEADVFDKQHVESSIGSPIVARDLVLAVSGWMGVRQEVIAVRPQRRGTETKITRQYCIDRGAPLCTTPLAVGDLLFLWSDDGIVTCADLASGEVHWRKRVRGTYYSSPIAAGDHVYNVSADGDLVVLKAAPEYALVSRRSLGEPSHSTPAISGELMFLRTFSQLKALRGSRPNSPPSSR